MHIPIYKLHFYRVIIIDLTSLLCFYSQIIQALSGFVALRNMVRHTESQFHIRQFD